MELMSENVRAAMCYTLGFITGVLFLFDGSPFVRFHAVQSTLTFSTIAALIILLPVIPGGVNALKNRNGFQPAPVGDMHNQGESR